MRKFLALTPALGVILAAWAPALAYEAVEVRDGGTVAGTIRYEGTVTVREKPKTKDTEVCGKAEVSQDLIVGPDKGLANVVVMLTVEKGKKWSADKVVLDQGGCDFHPHVLVVPTGADVKVLNPDRILHNFHTLNTKNPPVNRAMSKWTREMTIKFAQPEIMKVVCDTHDWMWAWLIVSEHPYVAVTDAQGHFEIKDVPAGSYKVEIWHEKLGKEMKEVSLKPGNTTVLDLTLRGK